VVSELSDLLYFFYTTFAHTMTMLPIINKLKFLSYQRPTAYRYGSGPERSGGMLSSRPKKCRYAIPAHAVSLRALLIIRKITTSATGSKLYRVPINFEKIQSFCLMNENVCVESRMFVWSEEYSELLGIAGSRSEITVKSSLE